MFRYVIFFIILITNTVLSTEHKLIYKAYVHGIPAGKTVVLIRDDKIEVKGETTGLINIFYRYEFYFLYQKGKIKLIEKEGKKKKIYEGKKIHKKKPWLPLLVSFFKEDKDYFKKLDKKTIKIGEKLIRVKIFEKDKNEIFVFEPLKSKTKKIIFYVKQNELYPFKIEIYGKKDIMLVLEK